MIGARLDFVAPPFFDALLARARAGDTAIEPLMRALARGTFVPTTEFDLESTVLTLLGVPAAAAGSAVLASFLAARDLDLPMPPTDMLCVEPVFLRADATRTVLFDAPMIGLEPDEAGQLFDYLNRGLGEDIPVFQRGRSPLRWYLRSAQDIAVAIDSPRSLRGREVEDRLAALRRLGPLMRLVTEAQMLLHDAPLNAARIAAGRAPVNSIWVWGAGGGRAFAVGDVPRLVVGDDDALEACALAANAEFAHATAGICAALARGRHVVTVVAAAFEADRFDPAACFAQVLEPALRMLARRRIACVAVHGRMGRVECDPWSAWRIWRRPQTLLDQLEAHGMPAAGD